jgi:hypothetical protein
MTVKMTYTRESKREHTLTSAYLPYDSYEPNKGLREVIHDCCRNELHLIFGYDTSEYHTIWRAWISTHKENVQWYNWLAHILIFLIKVTSLLF